MIKKTFIPLFLLTLTGLLANPVKAQIRAVGSSTVFPFVAMAAEEFGRKTRFKTPIIESTGTGGGFKLFCDNKASNNIDFTNASRPIKNSEKANCQKGQITPFEVKIGYDGIVIASNIKAPDFALSTNDLFLALAKQVPINGQLVTNPYQNWQEINPALPDQKIKMYGPPPTSGTLDVFVELVMEKACLKLPEFKANYADKKARKKACHLIREDGAYIQAGENDNVIVQKLQQNIDAFGIFGFSFYEENFSVVKAAEIDGTEVSFENIASQAYPIARSLFVYFSEGHLEKNSGLKDFLNELTCDDALGPNGYLTFRGLIPLPEAERKAMQASVAKFF